MEERTGIFQWNVKWHGKALTSVPSAALTSGLLITLTTRLLEINPVDEKGLVAELRSVLPDDAVIPACCD